MNESLLMKFTVAQAVSHILRAGVISEGVCVRVREHS